VAWLGVALALGAGACSEDRYKVEHTYSTEDPQFARAMQSLLGPPIVDGNRVETLVNGDAFFPAMLDAIRSAEKSVTLETYIYWKGETGHEFTEALAERAAAGVKVLVIIDAMGSSFIDAFGRPLIERDDVQRLDRAGVRLALYHSLKWMDLRSAQWLNNRTHRKFLVVDGRVAFMGGAGIGDEWRGNAQDEHHWRDTHYRITGPVVSQIQGAFMDNWMDSTGEVLTDEDFFPPLSGAGDVKAQVFKTSFRGENESMPLMYLLSIAAASDSIRIGTPYFVPDRLTIQALLEARERGVDVRIIVPGPITDETFVRHVSRSSWGDLLRAGVRIYEYQPTMYHCKLMIVDGLWTSVGSSNLDPRSFVLNCEANLDVLDANFAREQARIFDDDLTRCKEVTYDDWRNRPLDDRIMELFAPVVGPQM